MSCLEASSSVASESYPGNVLSSVWVLSESYGYLRPAHWHSCNELQPEHKQRNPQQNTQEEEEGPEEKEKREVAVEAKLVMQQLEMT